MTDAHDTVLGDYYDLDSRSPLMDAALWKEDFTYMKFGRSYTLRLPRRFVVSTYTHASKIFIVSKSSLVVTQDWDK